MRRFRFLLILIMCIVMSLGLAGSLSASDLPGMVKSLSGIKGLDVFVFELPDEASKAGLVAADLEEIVEKKLSFSKIDIRDDHRPPFLVLSLRSINNEEEKKIFYHLDIWPDNISLMAETTESGRSLLQFFNSNLTGY